MAVPSLTALLQAGLPDRAALPLDLERRLSRLVVAAGAAWVGVDVPPERFLPYLAARLPAHLDVGEGLDAVHATDLYLACGVAHGDAAALRALDARCLAEVGAAIAHLGGGSALADEVAGLVRERILVAPAGGLPKIAEFSGRGELRSWVRAVAVREALQVLRRHRRETPLTDRAAALLVAADDPEVAFLEQSYRAGFRTAFTDAVASLTPRERNLLRQHYLHDRSIDDLAGLYAAHRATVARWIARTRARLLKRTRRSLGRILGVDGATLDSVMLKAADHLAISLRPTLSAEPASGPTGADEK